MGGRPRKRHVILHESSTHGEERGGRQKTGLSPTSPRFHSETGACRATSILLYFPVNWKMSDEDGPPK